MRDRREVVVAGGAHEHFLERWRARVPERGHLMLGRDPPCGENQHPRAELLDDVEAGASANCRTVLVDNGHEIEWLDAPLRRPTVRVPDIYRAALAIVEASTITFMKPCVSPFSTARPTLVMGR